MTIDPPPFSDMRGSIISAPTVHDYIKRYNALVGANTILII